MSTSSCRSKLAFLAVDVNMPPRGCGHISRGRRTPNHSVHTLPRSRQDRRSRKSGAEHANDNELVKEAGRRMIYSLLVSGCFTYARRQISYQYLAEAILCSL